MIFLLNKKERAQVDKLIDTYFYNNEVADYLNNYVINQKVKKEDIKNYDIKALNINEYVNDDYYKNVHLLELKKEPYQIKYESYKINEAFLYDDLEVDEDDYFLIKNKIGYFNKPFTYPTIQKEDVIWMGVFPHEINTMKKCVVLNSTHVIIFGLGLAYFPYSFCRHVKKITIIDNDPTIIEIFKKHILPNFPNQDKYEIINTDALDYIKKIKRGDNVFVDLWHDVNDGFILYLKMKHALKDVHATYWIEDSMIAAYRNILINLINEEINNIKVDYNHRENEIDELTNNLHKYLLNKKFNNYSEIKKFLSKDSIKELIIKVQPTQVH